MTNRSFPSIRNPEDESLVSNDFSVTMGAIILGLVFLLGVPGNLFIIWSILARARRRSVTTLLILNLAIADGFLMVLTIFFVIYLAQQTWVFGDVMCKALFYLCNTNMYASIFLITLMSLHRLVAVVWPRKVNSLASKRIVKRAIAVLWVMVMFLSVPALVYREVREDKDERNKTRLVCAPNHIDPDDTKRQQVKFHYTFETVLGFILPYIIIVTSYVLILRRLRRTKFRRKVRSENLILAIVVVFGLFWLPYHIINIVQVVAVSCKEDSRMRQKLDHVWRSSRAVTSALAFISSCANPVLYTFAGKSYIRQDGFAFMARLFEGTNLDQMGTKKGRLTSKDNSMGLKELESTTSNGANAVRG